MLDPASGDGADSVSAALPARTYAMYLRGTLWLWQQPLHQWRKGKRDMSTASRYRLC